MILPDVLRKAADLIGEIGWTSGHTIDRATGGVCLDGALSIVCGFTRAQTLAGWWFVEPPEGGFAKLEEASKYRGLALQIVSHYLDEHGPTIPASPPSLLPKPILYNDKVAENAEDVQKVLRDAADWIEQHPALAEFHSSPEELVSA